MILLTCLIALLGSMKEGRGEEVSLSSRRQGKGYWCGLLKQASWSVVEEGQATALRRQRLLCKNEEGWRRKLVEVVANAWLMITLLKTYDGRCNMRVVLSSPFSISVVQNIQMAALFKVPHFIHSPPPF